MKRNIFCIATVFLFCTLLAGNIFALGNKDSQSGAATKLSWIGKTSADGIMPEINPLKVTGDIITAGSSTVFPLSEAVAELFREEGYGGNITIDSIGSGAGFERFTKAGETDIANASRPIAQKEIDQAKLIGRDPVGFKVGTDALAVVVNKKNGFLKNATKAELARIFSDAVLWSDVNAVWPKEKILRFIPGTDSGTFDYFVEEIFKKKKEPILNAVNLQLSEDDNILVQGILGNEFAIGFFGYAYYEENKSKLNIVNIEGIEPSADTVNKGTYPLSRPLFLYCDKSIMLTKPQVAAFIGFYLENVNRVIRKVGYFPVHDDVLSESKKLWVTIMKDLY